MIHTDYDAAVFTAEILMLLGILISAAYGVAVVIALVRKVFRRRPALFLALVLSALASLPLAAAIVCVGPHLSRMWDWNPAIGLIMLLDAALLFFVWVAPVIQYWYGR